MSKVSVSPLFDLVLVKLDKVPERRGMILVTPDSQLNNIRTAKVLAVGRGRKIGHHRAPNGVEPGEKVAFFRWHMEHKTGKQLTAFLEELEDNTALIRSADILFAYPEGTHVEVTQ
jgi:co-chaperonin GroES (HSP10)